MIRAFGLAVLLLACVLSPEKASAQQTLFVQTCGTFPPTVVPGTAGVFTIDINGVLCSNATGGSGDTGGVSNADNVAGATGFPRAQTFNYIWDAGGANWDRWSGAVTIAEGADVTEGSKGDGACLSDVASCSTISLLKRLAQNLTAAIAAIGSPIPAGTADIGNVGGRTNVTPTDCSGTITAGGTAQNAHTAQATLRGMTIANLDTTEVMWISFTTTAAASTVASYPLAPATATTFANLSSFTTPLGFGYNTALSVIAATTGHKFSCTRW